MNGEQTHEDCSVCLSELCQPCRTPCGHVYCTVCLRDTLKSNPPWNRGVCPQCRASVSLYNTVDVTSGDALEMARYSTIFGGVYLQHGEAGVAAYHFDAPNDCYISYEHAPAEWLLDDGSPPPVRKAFENPHYDEATRTFKGTVHWSDATFNGAARWEYEMKFADDFVIIAGGNMTAFDRQGNQTSFHRFPIDLRYVRKYQLPSTIAGQAYMQGGMLGVASYHFHPDVAAACISYEAAPADWLLDDGSRPPKRKAFDNPHYDDSTRTFTGTISWTEATFRGDSRWEYEMVFGADLKTIEKGQVRALDASGAERNVSLFGTDLVYDLYIEEEVQLLDMMLDMMGFREMQQQRVLLQQWLRRRDREVDRRAEEEDGSDGRGGLEGASDEDEAGERAEGGEGAAVVGEDEREAEGAEE